MRSIIFIFLLFIAEHTIVAQDTLYLNSNKIMSVKVIEVNDANILYTSFPYNGSKPIEINIAELQKIKFENGTVQYLKVRSLNKPKDYLNFGIIPFQLFSRSYGGYIGYSHKRLTIDYRYTYTFKYPTFGMGTISERLCYHGDNHSIILSNLINERESIGVLLGYKNWWYSEITFSKNGQATQSSFSQNEERSSHVKGINIGFEYSYGFSAAPFQGLLYLNCAGTSFKGTVSNHQVYSFNESKTQFVYIHVALGLKLGARIKTRTSVKI